MKSVLLATVISISLLSGCASVPMESSVESNLAKEFNSPSSGKAGIYVYRKDTVVGSALKKSVWIDKECVGETAKGVFFYHEVDGDEDHTISTESEFSANELMISMKNGMLYYVEQFIKMGVFVGGAGLEQKDEETGKIELAELKMATKGSCGE
ncbi:MAG: DUF2846 domain-containing protein [Thiotrichaceae bacterium]|nr:DUF2846 domain-containing protein [Thiotrichaceae bacterium]